MSAEQNRRDFPFVEPWKAALEAAFGPVKVMHARNGDKEIGERFEDRCRREGHVPCEYWPYGAPT